MGIGHQQGWQLGRGKFTECRGTSPGHGELLWWMCDAAEQFTPLSEGEEAELARRAEGLEPIFPQTY
jgi:hypothetical protein